jgi:hypothetical protein
LVKEELRFYEEGNTVFHDRCRSKNMLAELNTVRKFN